jgi:serine/threonine-protein kinase HipA|tara:strand:+ start:3864 stop:5105 length:1242 start_codon:yes stop_codon:yes gene_type:complete
MAERSPIYVYADWQELLKPQLMGKVHRSVVRGEEILAFEYEQEWLKRGEALLLDPRLQFVEGRQYPDASGAFGLLTDSAPDRWGRLLIQRRAALEQGASILYESDYVLAVADFCRMGGLRFKLDLDAPFLAEDETLSVPPMHKLRELEQASLRYEAADSDDPNYAQWLQMLLAPGTSLGGARPKASVHDPEGNLWVAKFPSRSDEYDVGVWEGLVAQLARSAGINVASSRIERFSGAGRTFLSQRFDRLGLKRVHFASAMCLLGYRDGDGAKTGASYLDLVDLIERYGAEVEADLAELWKRIVFNICIHNTDDHLRNHGFLFGEGGWRLSPAYDLNPQPWTGGLALNVDDASNACDLDLARSVGRYFRLSDNQQDVFINEVRGAVAGWDSLAEKMGIQRSEIERMRVAFKNGG